MAENYKTCFTQLSLGAILTLVASFSFPLNIMKAVLILITIECNFSLGSARARKKTNFGRTGSLGFYGLG